MGKTRPKEFKKLSDDWIKNMEGYFHKVDFSNVRDVAIAFGQWINLYFRDWNAKDQTWVDVDYVGYTTEDLFEEFEERYKKKVDTEQKTNNT